MRKNSLGCQWAGIDPPTLGLLFSNRMETRVCLEFPAEGDIGNGVFPDQLFLKEPAPAPEITMLLSQQNPRCPGHSCFLFSFPTQVNGVP